MEVQEIVSFIEQNKDNQDLTSALDKLGLVKPVEVIKEKELSDEELYNKFIGKQNLKDKLYNENTDKFLAKKLGIDVKDLTDDLRKTEFIPKNKLEEETGKFKNKLIQNELKTHLGEHYEVFKDKVDLSKVTYENEEFKGLNEQVEGIKTTFSKYFEVKQEVDPTTGKIKVKTPKPENDKKTQEDVVVDGFMKGFNKK